MAIQKDKLFEVERRRSIDIPEWKGLGEFTIRSIRGTEKELIGECAKKLKSESVTKDGGLAMVIQFNSFLVSLYLGDADGSRVFSESDFDKLKGLPSAIVDQIIREGNRYNNLAGDDADAEKKS